jgi:hypothetical protein
MNVAHDEAGTHGSNPKIGAVRQGNDVIEAKIQIHK